MKLPNEGKGFCPMQKMQINGNNGTGDNDLPFWRKRCHESESSKSPLGHQVGPTPVEWRAAPVQGGKELPDPIRTANTQGLYMAKVLQGGRKN